MPGRLSNGPPGGDSRRRDALALCILLITVLGYGIVMSEVPLIERDEGRYAEIPREMLATGNFVTPHLEGVVYLEKPPLYYWLNALSLELLGRTEIAVRIWSLTFGSLGILLTMLLGRRMFGPAVGRRAGLMLLFSPLYFGLLGVNIIDVTLTFFISSTLVLFWLADEEPRGNRWSWHGTFAAAALAVLTKGVIGLVLPVAVIGCYLLASRRLATLRRVPWITGITLFLLISVPWHVLIALETPGFLWFYFVHEHVLRYLTDTHARSQPVWFFLPILALGMLPWIGFLPRSVRQSSLSRSALENRQQRALLFLLVWCVVIVGFFSLSNSKLVPYVLPATLPLALLCGWGATRRDARPGFWSVAAHLAFLAIACALAMVSVGVIRLDFEAEHSPTIFALAAAALALAAWNLVVHLRDARDSRIHRLLLSAACLCSVVLVAASQVAEQATAEQISNCIGPESTAEVYAYKTMPQTLPFYLDRTIGLVDYLGEINYGISRLSDEERIARFPTAEEFLPRWRSTGQIYLVFKHRDSDKARAAGLTGRLVCEHGGYELLSNSSAVQGSSATGGSGARVSGEL